MRRLPIFYGWVIVGSGFLAQFIFGISTQAFATYLVPIGREFGWSSLQLGAPRSITQAESAALGPVQGYLIDRLGPRIVMGGGVFVLGAGMIMFGLVHNLWQYYLANIVIGIGGSFCGLIVVSTAVNAWFRRKRTMAIAITTVGLSVAGIIAVPIIVWLQQVLDWRWASIFSGIAVWIIGIPTTWVLQPSPEAMGLHPDGDDPATAPPAVALHKSLGGAGLVDFTMNEALRTRSFWMIGFGAGFYTLAQGAVFVYLFLHLEQGVGLSRAAATFAFGVLSAVNVVGRIAGGWLGDRYPKNVGLAFGSAGASVSIVLLAFATDIRPVLAFGVIYGFCWGLRVPLTNSVTGDYFGRASYGKILGTQQTISAVMGIIGPLAVGYLADLNHNYRTPFAAVAGIAMISALMFFLVRPPANPARLREEQAVPENVV